MKTTPASAVLAAVLVVFLAAGTAAAGAAPASATTAAPSVFVPDGAPSPPELSATAAVLMDVASGRILYARSAHEERPPASLTKIMTALLALEAGELDHPVEVSRKAATVGGSSIWLEAGEVQTVGDLLYGLMLRSGNDAAVAIAEHIAGSVSDFALLMNRRATEIGATGTHFRNPHGLPTAGHYTTAADLALIAREALLRPDFREVVSTRRHVIPWPSRSWDRAVYNENRLLWLYPGADGVKTGWTEEAGRCLVASATREGWQLVAVFLDAPGMWTDASQLLDWGFGAFNSMVLYRAGETVTQVRVAGATERWVSLTAGQDVRVAVLPGETERVEVKPETPHFVRSPLDRGTEVGSVRLVVDGVPLARAALLSAESIPVGGVVGRLLEDLWSLLAALLARLVE